jgi:hypothetical protein
MDKGARQDHVWYVLCPVCFVPRWEPLRQSIRSYYSCENNVCFEMIAHLYHRNHVRSQSKGSIEISSKRHNATHLTIYEVSIGSPPPLAALRSAIFSANRLAFQLNISSLRLSFGITSSNFNGVRLNGSCGSLNK